MAQARILWCREDADVEKDFPSHRPVEKRKFSCFYIQPVSDEMMLIAKR